MFRERPGIAVRRWIHGLSFVVCACLFVCVAPAATADVTPQRCAEPLRLDGELNDPCWQAAAPQSGFTPWRAEGEKLNDTEFRLAYDDTWLYIGLRCDNPAQNLIFGPKVTDHDGPVHTDESVEVFFDPGSGGRFYYHFILSCFDVKAEQSVKTTPTFVSDRRWNHPWRSAVQRSKTGWTAEMGIPLYLVASYGDFEKMRLNVIRNRRVPFMDAQMQITHDDKYSSSWRPVQKSFHEPASFAPVVPLRPKSLQIPFLPSLERSEVGSPYLKGDERFFDVTADVRGSTDRSGDLELAVEDRPATGTGATVRERFTLTGREAKKLTVAVPMTSIANRQIDITLRDAKTSEVWGRSIVENPPSLNVLHVYLDRNYYTSEKNAVLVAEIGLPAESLKNLAIVVRGPDEAVLARGQTVSPETHVAFPLAKMAVGAHVIKMEARQKGRSDDAPAMLSGELQLIKRAPKPGLEWKIDQIDRVLLKPDGEPVFLFGPVMAGCAPDDEEAFRQLAAGGFNTFVQWHRYLKPEETVKYLEMSKKHGLYAMSQLETGWLGYKEAGLALPQKYLTEGEQKQLFGMGRTGSIGMRGYLMHTSATYAQRTEMFNEYYFKNVELAEKMIRSVMNEDNLIGYNTFDEATSDHFFRISDSMVHLRNFTHQTDGYHPVLAVSGTQGAPTDRVFDGAADIFTPDPYWHPTSGIRETATPVVVAKRMYLSDETCKIDRKVLWAVPMGWVWSGILAQSKRPISAEEQHCQNFLAVIHGVRGLFWFRWPMHEIGWKNLTDTAKMIQVIGPMAVQPKVRQTVAYEKIAADGKREPAPFDTVADNYPDVHGVVFRDPKGGLVLVAANSTYYPVRAEFKVSGLTREVRRVFADARLTIRDGAFAEALEPLAVRAYRLGDPSEPLAVSIAAQRTGPASPLAKPALVNKWRPDKKNILPNPSFEEETLAGLPDYYIAIENGVAIERDPAIVKFGAKCVRLDANVAYSVEAGRTRMRSILRGALDLETAPQVKAPTPHVLSLWLRGQKGGETVEVKVAGERTRFILENDWKRYSMPVIVRPGLTLRDGLNLNVGLSTTRQAPIAACWVDGIQLEKGETPTPFED